MSDNDHTSKISNFFRRMAIDNGYIITPDQGHSLILLSDNMRSELAARLYREASELRCEGSDSLARLVPELSACLTLESLARLREMLSSFLQSLAKDLHLSDVKTEVLMSWLAEIEASDSSSVQDGESVGELPTPSRTGTVAAPSYTKEAARTHGGAA